MTNAQVASMRRKNNAGKPRRARAAKRPRRRDLPVLRFSPHAWAKLLYLRDYGDTEVGGFGISRAIPFDDDDLLFVEDVRLVRQRSTPVSILFDDIAVADFFDEQVDQGRRLEQFARIWSIATPVSPPRRAAPTRGRFRGASATPIGP